MLSLIVSLASGYQHSHGVRPNLVYMSEAHYGCLREELPGLRSHEEVLRCLGMDIAFNAGTLRPHVSRVQFSQEHILAS